MLGLGSLVRTALGFRVVVSLAPYLALALGHLHLFPRLSPDTAFAARRPGASRDLKVVVILGGLVEVDVQRVRAARLVERRAFHLRVCEAGRVVGVSRGGDGVSRGGSSGGDVLLRALPLEQHSHLALVFVAALVPVTRLVPLLLLVVRKRGILVFHVIVVVREKDVLRLHRVVRHICRGVAVAVAVAVVVFHPRPLFELAHRRAHFAGLAQGLDLLDNRLVRGVRVHLARPLAVQPDQPREVAELVARALGHLGEALRDDVRDVRHAVGAEDVLDRGEAGLAVGLLLRRGHGSVPVQGVAGQVPGQVPRRRRHAGFRPRLLRDPLLARRAAVLTPVAGFAALETRAARAARSTRALRRRVRHLRAASFVFSVAIEGREGNKCATPCARRSVRRI